MSSHRFLVGGMTKLMDVNEKDAFGETVRAMNVMGISANDQESIFRVISALLLLGNMEFKQDRTSDQASLPNNTFAQKAADLLGLQVTDMTKAFLKPRMKVGRDMVRKAQTKEQVEYAVEAICKATYEKLFKWLVQHINRQLNRTTQDGASFIGILDIAGFEIFKTNSFEQLCINYTNEKLQQLFNHTMFQQEQEEYGREGIQWDFIDFGLDLQPCIDLIEKNLGVLSLLDEECFFPKATHKTFVDKLLKTQDKHPKLLVPEFRAAAHFGIVHYAGRVDYDTTKWLEKNMDPLNENVLALLHASTDPFVHDIWKDVENHVGLSATAQDDSTFGASRTRKGMFRTVSQLYKESLVKLMAVLKNTNPNFVRCIIPNHEKKPEKLDCPLILDQLKCNGVIEGIRICRQGFPNRITFQEFRQRYEVLTPTLLNKGYMDARKAAVAMVAGLDIHESAYRIGQSKIFFKAGILAVLETERDIKISRLITQFQSFARGYEARKNIQLRANQFNAARIIQRNCLSYQRLRHWPWWKLFTRIRPLLSVATQAAEKAKTEEEVRQVKENLATKDAEIKETKEILATLTKQKSELTLELQNERAVALDAEEERQRLISDLKQAEHMAIVQQTKAGEGQDKIDRMESEVSRMRQDITDLKDQLEAEEQQRQRAQCDKSNIEQKLYKMQEDCGMLEEKHSKVAREKKALEERLNDIQGTLSEEEGRNQHIIRLNAKNEATISELDAMLNREQTTRQDLERTRSRLEVEKGELLEQIAALQMENKNLKIALEKAKEEIVKMQARVDEEIVQRTLSVKQVKELQSQNTELKEDLEAECRARDRAEKMKRDQAEELEAMRMELIDTGNTTEETQKALRSREKDMMDIHDTLEAERKVHQQQLHEFRSAQAAFHDEMQDQLEQKKQIIATLEKSKQQMGTELSKLTEDLQALQGNKSENEKRRKHLAQEVSEKTNLITEAQNNLAYRDQQIKRLTEDNERLGTDLFNQESRVSSLTKANATLTKTLEELRTAADDECSSKVTLQSKIRQVENEREQAKDLAEEMERAKDAAERHSENLKAQMEQMKEKAEEENAKVEAIEESKKKILRERDELQSLLEEKQEALENSEKAKKKYQTELEDANHTLESRRTDQAGQERRAKKVENALSEAQGSLRRVSDEKQQLERELQEKGSQILSMSHRLQDAEDKASEYHDQVNALNRELDKLTGCQDSADNVVALERAKFQLEREVADYEQQIEDLKEESAIFNTAKQRLEIQLSELKSQHERDSTTKEEEYLETSRALQRRVRELESELEDERGHRNTLLQTRLKTDATNAELVEKLEAAERSRDDAARAIRRLQTALSTSQKSLEEATTLKDGLQGTTKDLEKRLRTIDKEKDELQEEVFKVGRQRRIAMTERDSAVDKMENLIVSRDALLEEKKRFDSRISLLEEEIEEKINSLEAAEERYRRANSSLEKLQCDLNNERISLQKMETQKISLERQVKDLREKLAAFEGEDGRRKASHVNSLETLVATLKVEIETASQEKMKLQKNCRKLEKELRDTLKHLDEERSIVENAQQHKERALLATKRLRHDILALEEENSDLKAQKRKIQRSYEELSETNSTIEREAQVLRAKLSRFQCGRSSRASLTPFGVGDEDHTDQPECDVTSPANSNTDE